MKIMSVDLGDTRTGLARCDKDELLAFPVETIVESNKKKLARQIKEKIDALQIELVVIGMPLNMDGSHGPRAKITEDFAALLKNRIKIPIIFWDERQTTRIASFQMNLTNTRGKKRKAALDQAAAVAILESYLSYRKNQGERK